MRSNIEVKRCDATFYSMFHLSEWNVANTFVDCLTSCAAPRASHGSEASACCQVHPAIGCDGGSRRERRSAHHGGKPIKERHSDAATARTKCVLDTHIRRGRERCRHQSVHFDSGILMRVSSTHFVRAIAASLWRALIALPPWCALRRSRLLPPSRRRPSRRTKLVPSARHVDRSFWPRHLCGRPAAIYDLREMPVANATRERPTMPCF